MSISRIAAAILVSIATFTQHGHFYAAAWIKCCSKGYVVGDDFKECVEGAGAGEEFKSDTDLSSLGNINNASGTCFQGLLLHLFTSTIYCIHNSFY